MPSWLPSRSFLQLSNPSFLYYKILSLSLCLFLLTLVFCLLLSPTLPAGTILTQSSLFLSHTYRTSCPSPLFSFLSFPLGWKNQKFCHSLFLSVHTLHSPSFLFWGPSFRLIAHTHTHTSSLLRRWLHSPSLWAVVWLTRPVLLIADKKTHSSLLFWSIERASLEEDKKKRREEEERKWDTELL